MLTEKRNVASVHGLINEMVNNGYHSSTSFKKAVMNFLLAFSEHIGEKYSLRAYSEFFQELDYRRNLIDETDGLSEHSAEEWLVEQLQLEQGLLNTLDALNCFFAYVVNKVGTDSISPQDEAEDDFLFTVIREARNLQESYFETVNEILSERIAIFRSFSGQKEKMRNFAMNLRFRKDEVARYNFNSDSLIDRQKKRKKNELYKSGARTNQPLDFSKMDASDKKADKKLSAELDDIIASKNDPWNRVGKFKIQPRPKSKAN